MKTESKKLEQTIRLAKQLTPLEKVCLIEELLPDVAAFLEAIEGQGAMKTPPLRSVYGLCADLGEAPTAEEIDAVRRQFLETFPREDV